MVYLFSVSKCEIGVFGVGGREKSIASINIHMYVGCCNVSLYPYSNLISTTDDSKLDSFFRYVHGMYMGWQVSCSSFPSPICLASSLFNCLLRCWLLRASKAVVAEITGISWSIKWVVGWNQRSVSFVSSCSFWCYGEGKEEKFREVKDGLLSLVNCFLFSSFSSIRWRRRSWRTKMICIVFCICDQPPSFTSSLMPSRKREREKLKEREKERESYRMLF